MLLPEPHQIVAPRAQDRGDAHAALAGKLRDRRHGCEPYAAAEHDDVPPLRLQPESHAERPQHVERVKLFEAIEIIQKATVAVNPERQEFWQEAFRMIHEDIVSDVQMFHMIGFTRVSPRINFTPTISTNSEIQVSTVTFNE